MNIKTSLCEELSLSQLTVVSGGGSAWRELVYKAAFGWVLLGAAIGDAACDATNCDGSRG